MALTLVTGPAGEPVSLGEAKGHLRVDISEDDALIGGLITAARMHVEQHLKRALMTQTWELVLDCFPSSGGIRLPLPPLASVVSVKYTDVDGVEGTFAASNYLVDTDREPGLVRLKRSSAWPAVELQEVGGVRVRYVAGYGNAGATPRPIRQAILLLVGSLYENREDTLVAQGVTVMALPFGVKALLMPYRILRM
jgi:uncharacterized phiE125 gp8 family phage protein